MCVCVCVCFSTSCHQMSTLQYADDTCLTASSKEGCQAMLDATEKWLDWSLTSIDGQTGRTTNPGLHITQEKIPYLGSNFTSFLGLPINATLSLGSIKEQIHSKLESFLTATDQSPLSRQQKLRIYRLAICPRLTWLLSLTDLPLTWVERTLEPLATRLLKKWYGISRLCTNLPVQGKWRPGHSLHHHLLQESPSVQVQPAETSTDSTYRFLAERKHARDIGTHRKRKPTEEVIATMQEYPNAARSKLASEARKRVTSHD